MALVERVEPGLTPSSRVILGMIALGKQTGYDIKQLVDKSTRHFWAVSYGQIYPELRRLEQRGLVRGRPEPSGGRARTVYELTEAGRLALRGWLRAGDVPQVELRHEGMLKLFFSDFDGPERRIEYIRAIRSAHEHKLTQLRAIEPVAQEAGGGKHLTLQLGIHFNEQIVKWCEATEGRLADAQATKGGLGDAH
jgi:DNA-binding PadR family transcriptional regulator